MPTHKCNKFSKQIMPLKSDQLRTGRGKCVQEFSLRIGTVTVMMMFLVISLVGEIQNVRANELGEFRLNADIPTSWVPALQETMEVETSAPTAGVKVKEGLWLTGDIDGNREVNLKSVVSKGGHLYVWKKLEGSTFKIYNYSTSKGYRLSGNGHGIVLFGDFGFPSREQIIAYLHWKKTFEQIHHFKSKLEWTGPDVMAPEPGESGEEQTVFLDCWQGNQYPLVKDCEQGTRFLEVSQVVQDLGHTVPLVSGKTTIVRAYVNLDSGPAGRVKGRLHVLVRQPDGTFPTETFSVDSINSVAVSASDIFELLHEKRPQITRSLNFCLPPEWTETGDLVRDVSIRGFTGRNDVGHPTGWSENWRSVQVNAGEVVLKYLEIFEPPENLGQAPPLNCEGVQPNTPDSASTLTGNLIPCTHCGTLQNPLDEHHTFLESPNLRLKVVGIGFQPPTNSDVQEPQWPRAEDVELVKSWIRRTFPIDPNPSHQKLRIVYQQHPSDSTNPSVVYGNPNFNDCTDADTIVHAVRDLDEFLLNATLLTTATTHYLGLVYDGGVHPDHEHSRWWEQCSTGVSHNDLLGDLWTNVASAWTGPGPLGPECACGSGHPCNSSPNTCSVDINRPFKPLWDFDGNDDDASLNDPTSYGDWYLAHELGHLLGQSHIRPAEGTACGAELNQPDQAEDFPYAHSQLADEDHTFVGLDVGDSGNGTGVSLGIEMKALPGWVSGSTEMNDSLWHDFMGYCSRQWMSAFTYKKIFERLHLETDEFNLASAGGSIANLPEAKKDPHFAQILHSSHKLQTSYPNNSSRNFSMDPPNGFFPTPSGGNKKFKNDSGAIILARNNGHHTNGENRIPKRRAKFKKGEFVSVFATLNLTKKTGEIKNSRRKTQAWETLLPIKSSVEFRLSDRSGKQIIQPVPLTPYWSDSQDDLATSAFDIPIPQDMQPFDLALIELMLDGKRLGFRKISKEAPALDLNSFQYLEASGVVDPITTFCWDPAADRDSEQVTYTLQVKTQESKVWEIVGVGLSKPKIGAPMRKLVGQSPFSLRIISQDEFHHTLSTFENLQLQPSGSPQGCLLR
jgi:hypothetical protein